MKRYKNGKMIDVSKEEAEKIQKRFEARRNVRKPSDNDLEARVKALEDTLAAIQVKQNNKEETN